MTSRRDRRRWAKAQIARLPGCRNYAETPKEEKTNPPTTTEFKKKGTT